MDNISSKIEEIGLLYPIIDLQLINGHYIKKLHNFGDIYEFVKLLGSGASGIVNAYRERSTGNLYAIKEIILDNSNVQIIQNEINVLSKLSHDGIVKYFDSYICDQDGIITYIIIMEYIEGYTLQQYIDSLKREPNLKFVVNLMIWLFQTLNYLHNKSYVHRDIKPDNIMIDIKNKRFVLIDFGLTCNIQSKPMCNYKEFVGSAAFIAPEKWNAKNNKNLIKVDIWAAGITIFNVLERKLPWDGILSNSLEKEISEGHIPFSIPDNSIREYLEESIRFVLNVDPDKRPYTDAVLKHMFDKLPKFDNRKNIVTTFLRNNSFLK